MRRPLISVFAVEDTAVQVVWRALPAAEVWLHAGDRVVRVEATQPAWLRRHGRPPRRLAGRPGEIGGPGAVVIDGLAPATPYRLTATGDGSVAREVARFRTLASPPGPLLTRFATLNDIHIGERNFGGLRRIEDVRPLPPGWPTYTLRCAKAAIEEALAWGAEALVVKGDLTGGGKRDEFAEVGRLLSGWPVPIEVILGNHEFHSRTLDPRVLLGEVGIEVPTEPWFRDLAGIRLILGQSPVPGKRYGAIHPPQRDRLAWLAAGAPAGAFVALHHHPQRWRLPTQYPPGIPGPQARALLDALADANPATMVATGHTHRNRCHRHGPVVVAETGSTKDYPGSWAGYAVHEGGIRQVIRRIGAPEAMSWTEGTYWALGGAWGRWSPGRLAERCFSHAWPDGSAGQ